MGSSCHAGTHPGAVPKPRGLCFSITVPHLVTDRAGDWGLQVPCNPLPFSITCPSCLATPGGPREQGSVSVTCARWLSVTEQPLCPSSGASSVDWRLKQGKTETRRKGGWCFYRLSLSVSLTDFSENLSVAAGTRQGPVGLSPRWAPRDWQRLRVSLLEMQTGSSGISH